MQDAEIVPLRLIADKTQLYVNLSGEVKEVLIWAAAHGAAGQVRAGPDQMPGHEFSPPEGTVFIKAAVQPKEAVFVTPGNGGVIAIRLVQV